MQKNDIESNEKLSTQAEAKIVPEKQENVRKKLSVIMQSVSYKYTHIYLLKIMHTLIKKMANLKKIES